jgi:UDP-N-acetylmuramoyl-tripeptide--D-alanyl-D-alanine ligase
MPDFTPEQLELWTGGCWTSRPAGVLCGFGIDTRLLEKGQVFVALKSERRDGHDFLQQAALSCLSW